MNKKDGKALVQAMREAGFEAHLIVHGTKRRTYSALLVPYGTFFSASAFVKWLEKREQARQEATGHE